MALEDAATQGKSTGRDPDKDNAHLFEEFRRPAQPGDPPKPRGLNAQGYRFPPQVGTPPLTKENLAKGAGLPSSANAVPPMPTPSELVEKAPLFEEYHRLDLKEHPRTGKGLRAATAPKTAKEILQGYEPPEPEVVTGKRMDRPAIALPASPEPIIHPARRLDRDEPAAAATTAAAHAQELDAAHLDAEADVASAPQATMSHSRSHGPTRTVTDRDPFAEMPNLPRGPDAADHQPTHTSDAPPVPPGDGPRIALVQADFNYQITTHMAEAARRRAHDLGCAVGLHVHVSGAFDIPPMAKALAARPDVDAVVAIGCIVQGETGHDTLIAQECARKLADLAYESGKPVGLAVTGPRMTRAAAQARAEVVPQHAVDAVVKQWRAFKALGAARMAATH